MHSYLHGHPALSHAVKRLERLNPDQFELYFEHRTSTKIESKDRKIDTLTQSQDVGISVRVLKDRRLGFSFTTSLEKPSIDQAVDAAFEVAKYMPEDDNVALRTFGSAPYPNVDNFDGEGVKAPIAQKVDLAKRLEDECRKADPRIAGVRSASVGESLIRVHMVDSSGEHIHHESTTYTASVSCKAEQDGDSQMGGDFGFANDLQSLDVKAVGTVAAGYATELLGAKTPPTLICPAVLRNNVVADLIDFLSSSFSAEQVDKGRSMLAGKIGQRLFAENITLIDDGLMPGGLATFPFDAEGVPTARTTLVDGGFVAGYLYDTYYAKKMGADPTGNASRGIKSPPGIGTTNTYMKNGKKVFSDLVKGINRGIVITDLMGVHTANPVTGDFSLGASGILIEGGKLARPVRGFAVAGNILDLLRRVTDVGSDLRFFGSTGAPSVRVSEISVGGA
jgi:PmbA protein